MRVLQPSDWARPRGYANGISARGTHVFVGGQIGWNAQQRFEREDFAGQARQALENVVAVLAAGGARPEHVVRMTWYLLDRNEYVANLAPLGQAYRALFGRHYPVMSAVEVRALVEPQARLEIEATAVIPEATARRSRILRVR